MVTNVRFFKMIWELIKSGEFNMMNVCLSNCKLVKRCNSSFIASVFMNDSPIKDLIIKKSLCTYVVLVGDNNVKNTLTMKGVLQNFELVLGLK
ncbi:hypothetical protein CR513_26553, partial [Mucuna pruriens]